MFAFILCMWPFRICFCFCFPIYRAFFFPFGIEEMDLGWWFFFKFRFIICLFSFMWVRICRCVYRCTGVEVTFWCCDLGDSYVVLLRQDLPLGPEVCVLSRLDWLVSRPQVPACLTSPALGFQVWAAMPSFDTGAGDDSQVLVFAWQASSVLSLLALPSHCCLLF